MEKMIYHGSDHIIERPEFGYGKTYNDYGTGFYCTENPNMAKEWYKKKLFVINPHAVNILIPNETTDNGGIYISPLFWMRR